MASVKVHVEIGQALQQKLEQINTPSTMLAIHNTLYKRCDPYVPFLEGPLSQTAVVSAEGVRYIQPYARRQYYGDDFNHTTEFHPLASARWDKAMLADHGQEFYDEVKEILKWRMMKVGS